MRARSWRGAQQSSSSAIWLALILLAWATLPTGATAQVTSLQVDLTGSRLKYGESLEVNAVSLTPELTAEWPLAVFRGVASYSQLSGGGSGFQGTGGFSLYTPSYRGFSAELEAFGGGTRSGETTTSQVLGIARAHLAGSTAGVWLGGGAGTASNSGERRPSQIAELGAWFGTGATRASVSVIPTVVDDTIKFTDLNFAATTSLRRLQLVAFAGSRSGSQPEIFGTPVKSWAGASIVTRITSSVAAVVAAGRYPVDLTQGFPGGAYGSVGLRMAARLGAAEATPRSAPATPILPSPADAPIGNLLVAPLAANRKLIFIRVPAARRIELAGAFSEWQPLAMSRRPEGWWSIELPLPAGSYEVSIRVDGGPWIAPPGLMTIRDEFDVEGGLLIVP